MLISIERLQDLIRHAQALHKGGGKCLVESVNLIGALHRADAPSRLRRSPVDFAKLIGLTPDQYFKRLRVARCLPFFPLVRKALEHGDISFSQLVVMSSKLSDASQKTLLEGVKGMSQKETREFVCRVSLDGSVRTRDKVCQVMLRLSPDEIALIDRACKVFAAKREVPDRETVVVAAVTEFLAKHDPDQKAERAGGRWTLELRGSDQPVPAPVAKWGSSDQPVPAPVAK